MSKSRVGCWLSRQDDVYNDIIILDIGSKISSILTRNFDIKAGKIFLQSCFALKLLSLTFCKIKLGIGSDMQ